MGCIKILGYSLTGYVIGGTFGFLVDRLTRHSFDMYYSVENRFTLNNTMGYLGLLTGGLIGYLRVPISNSIKN